MTAKCFLPSLLFSPLFALGGTVAAPPSPQPDPFAGRLTGDWDGARRTLAEHGLTVDLDFTGFWQGMPSGDGSDDWDFGGRGDLFLTLQTEKAGLWAGGGFHTHLEYRDGNLPGSRGGALWPVNTGMVLPLSSAGEAVATSLYFSQRAGDHTLLMAGKINAVDLLAADPFFGGWGTQRFQNIAFVAPPSGVVPPVIMGAVVSIKSDPVSWTFMVFDPNDRTSDYFPGDLFDDGVNLSLGATWSGSIAGRKTSIGLTGTYSTKDGTDFEDILLPPGLATTTKDGSWNVALQVSHALTSDPARPLGLYFKAAVADGNPNPIQASFSGGIAGKGLFASRPADTFGLGYYYYNFSDDLQDTLSALVDFDDEQGLEFYYTWALTPWWQVSANLQWIDPARGAADDAFVAGVRTRISF